jgi:hypothetical protein
MRHNDTAPDSEWCVHSIFVPKRDGGQRAEAAIRAILAPPTPDPPTPESRHDHEHRHLRPRLDPPPGARPDD